MKRLFFSVLILLVLVTCLSSVAFGYTYTRNEDTFDGTNFQIAYVKSAPDQNNGPVTMRYNPASWFMDVRASTDLNVATDMGGYAFVKLCALNGEVNVIASATRDGNIINSGKASVAGQTYAKRVEHFAYRDTTDTHTDYWDYKVI